MKVFNRLAYFSLVLVVFSVAPAFAAGNLTVTSGSFSAIAPAGDSWNTGLNAVLNISVNSTGEVNITSILINFTGTANLSNITAVLIYNDTDSDTIIDPDEVVIGSNSSLNSNLSSAVVPITVVSNFSVRRTLLIAFNISRAGFRANTTGAMIASNVSVRTTNADALDNINIPSGSINSTNKTILDMHANATLSPRIVDTNVSEQMLVYTITPTSQNTADRIQIIVPVGYTLVNVTDVYVGTTRYTRNFAGTNGSEIVGVILNTTEFNLSFTTPGPTNAIKINFTVNTNLSARSSAAFTSKIFGNNLTFVSPDVSNEETNVTTTQIIQVLSVSANKTAALMNGTDYWEFTFRLNFTANVSGLIQFRMNNWTSNQGTINLTNNTATIGGTQFYASLRNDTTITNNTQIVNATENYNLTQSIRFNVTADTTAENTVTRPKHVILRMTIPSGIPVSSGWYTVYSILFRSNPT